MCLRAAIPGCERVTLSGRPGPLSLRLLTTSSRMVILSNATMQDAEIPVLLPALGSARLSGWLQRSRVGKFGQISGAWVQWGVVGCGFDLEPVTQSPKSMAARSVREEEAAGCACPCPAAPVRLRDVM